jgi:peptidoglycan hydrolase-like protein with peptidoglycan-binding domain
MTAAMRVTSSRSPTFTVTGSGVTPLPTTSTTANTTGIYTYKFVNFLGVGSTGTDVTKLQQRLTAEGVFSGTVSGYFGALTKAAVKKYQALHGLDQFGYVGPGTRAMLNSGV